MAILIDQIFGVRFLSARAAPMVECDLMWCLQDESDEVADDMDSTAVNIMSMWCLCYLYYLVKMDSGVLFYLV